MNIRRHPKALIETFESRILYSADPGPAGLAAAVLGGFDQPGNGTGGAVQQGGSELVFVDSRVPDIQQLLDDLAVQQRAGRTVEVFLVGSDDDGIALIGASLAGRHDIAAVHVLGHGSAGVAEVGATRLDAESVFLRAGEIAAWGDALSVDADLLLYGCDVAADAGGRSLVSALAQLTGADVAASDDLTGAAALGGDWNLEYATGSIETALAPSGLEQQAWSGILAISANGTATSTNSTSINETTPLSWSHTVAAGSNRVMFVELSISTTGTTATGVSYGGVAMTLVGRSSSGVVPVEIWKLVNPQEGTANVVASFSATAAVAAGATTYNGVDQTTPVRVGSFVSGFGNSTTASVTVASAVGDLVIDAQSWQGLPSGGAPGAGQTLTWWQQNASITGGSTSEGGAASVTMSGSFSSSANWVIGAVSLKPAAGITVTPISGLTVTEAGGTAQFSVVLDSAPTANVTVGLSSSNTKEGTLSASSLTFTTANWNVAQTVTVTGVDDTYIDGNTAFSVTTAAASSDLAYSVLNPADVSLTNTDNDTVNTLVVDTILDTADGTTTSIAALMANKGTDGKISLREAITAANATANGSGGADRIHFGISGTGIHTITLGSLLPDIVDAVSIDATTDDSFAAAGSRPAIVLDGGNTVQDGLRLYPGSGGSTIRGLIIQRFTQDGIDIGSSSGNTVAGNWIGLNSAGTGAAGNQQGVNIWNASNNIIGGITAADRNVLSGNTGEGVFIGTDNATSTGNQIRGNYIGTNAAGTAAVGNSNWGVLIESGASNTVGGSSTAYGNVIAGTLNFEGIQLGATASSTTVSANIIGLAADGSTVLGNAGAGLLIRSANNTIGGTTAGARNILSGNASGLIVSGASATGNLIAGNYIGTDSTGMLDRGNTTDGVRIEAGATSNTVGGSTTGHRNIISGNNQDAVQVDGEASDNNIVRGNWIGINAAGTATLGNSGDGVFVSSGADGTYVGGSTAAEGNWIAAALVGVEVGGPTAGMNIRYNRIGTDAAGTANWGMQANGILIENSGGGAGPTNVYISSNTVAFSGQSSAYDAGIEVLDTAGANISISANSIYSNVGMGIDLGVAGVTANDAGDADTGPNNLQNYPVLTSATYGGDRVLIVGTLNSTASTSFRIEFFSSVSGDASAHGEGQVFLGAASVTTDSSGNASFSVQLTGAGMTSSRVVSATATVDLGGGTYGSTSEFSANINSVASGPTVSAPPTQTVAEDGSLVFSSANGNGITVGDGMAGDGRLQVALASPNGTLTLGGTAGLTVVGGANGSAGMVLWGTKSALNAALNGLTFTPVGNFNGSASISVTSALAADLAGYYPFAGGSTADQAAGAMQSATLLGNAAVVTDPTRGEVLSLDGNGDALQIDSLFGQPQNVTIGGWVNLTKQPPSGRAEFISLDDRVHIALDDAGGVKGSVQVSAGTWTDLNSNRFLAGTGWHHVMYVFDDANDVHSLYIDGSLIVSAANTNTIYYTGATTTYIGRHPTTTPGFDFKGQLDDVRIYDRALTASEVGALAIDFGHATSAIAVMVTAVNDAPTFDAADFVAATSIGAGNDRAYATVVQPDGKIVVAGYTHNGSNLDFVLVRYNADGTLDTGFGGGDGIVTQAIGAGDDEAYAVALQADGKILVAGRTANGGHDDFALVRYLADGSLDTSFGGGDGIVTTDFGSGSSDQARSMVVQSDGRIVLGGKTNLDIAVARYLADGTLDTSFSGDGKHIVDVAGSNDEGLGLALQADGRIIQVGSTFIGGNQDFAVLRYNTDGSLDTSFGGGDGIVTTPIGTSYDIAHSVVVQRDGKIVVGGYYGVESFNNNFAVVRYAADGSLDTTFGGGDGIATTDFGGVDVVWSLALQSDNKIVAAGGSGVTAAVVRYAADGSLDTSFSGDGMLMLPLNSGSYFCAMAVQSDGRIVLTGFTTSGSNDDVLTLGLTADGQLDTRANPGSTSLGGTVSYTENGSAVVLDSNVRIYDTELSAANNFNGATLTLLRSGGASAQDVFSATGNLAALIPGGNLVLSGVTVGTVTTHSAGTLLLTFNSSATQARINEVMNSIAYANSSDTPPASVVINWTFNDGNTGAQGTGGALTATGSTTVSITAINDAPAVTTTGTSLAYTENAAATAVDSGLAVSDVDTTTLTSATVSITTGFVTGQDTLAFTNQNGITGSWSAGTGVLTLTGSATVANYQTALQSVTYVNSSEAPSTATRTVSFVTNDGSANSAAATRDITVTAINDAPVVTTTSSALAYTENAAATAVDSGLTVSDADTATLTSATVSITGGFVSGEDVLAFTNQNGITGSWSAGTGVLTLTGSATLANYQTALRSVTYINTSDNPSSTTRTVSFQVNDGTVGSTTATRNITVTAINDAPVLATTSSTLAYTENAAATAVDSGLTGSDVDTATLTSATVSITGGFVTGQDVLAFTDQNGITGSWNAGTGVLTLTGSATLANYQTALRSVTYINTSDNPSTATRTVSFVTSDGSISSAAATRGITITAINDAPVFTGLDGAPTYTPGRDPVVLDADVQVFDAELSQANFDGVTLLLQRSGGANGQDVFSATGTLSFNGGTVSVGATAIGSVTTNSAGTLRLTFNADATNALVNSALQQIAYSNSGSQAGSVQIDWTLSDGNTGAQGAGGALGAGGSVSVSLLSPPGITVSAISGATTEAGGTASFTVVLDALPTGDVTIAVSSSNPREGTVSTSLLSFTAANWNVAQTVTITGIDDTVVDGNRAYTVVLGAASSTDGTYKGVNPADVVVTNSDNDTQSTIIVTTASDAADAIDGDTSSLYALLQNKGSDGLISLREAIIAANNSTNGSGGADRILFGIAGTGEHLINLEAALPAITDAVILDASTDDSFAANSNKPAVVLDGNTLTASGLELTASADGSTIRGLVIRDFDGSGIVVQAGSDGNTLAGNYIGRLNPAGDDAGASEANTQYGVYIAGANNTVGGPDAADGNVISGNLLNGVHLAGAAATGNTIQGNRIGTNSDGTAAIGNQQDGIYAQLGAASTTVVGNLIAGNVDDGIEIVDASSGNLIHGNIIGLGADGSQVIGNGDNGIVFYNGVSGSMIGGTTPAERNVISGNTGSAIVIDGAGGTSTTGNTVAGNLIGTDSTGLLDRGNGATGIVLKSGAGATTLGGSIAGAGNVIAGNLTGILIDGETTDASVIQGNRIGVGMDGTTAIGNAGDGVRIANGADDSLIGGTTAAAGNLIANHTGSGINIASADSTGNALLGNRISASGALGIDLGGDGISSNDTGDADTGANNRQNTPVLTSALTSGTDIALAGTLNSVADTHFRIEFFASASPNLSGYGEGQIYLGSVDVLTDAGGDASFNPTFGVAVPTGHVVSATATRLTSGLDAVETSEFSISIFTNVPVITSNGGGSTAALPVAENSTVATTVTATDPDGAAQNLSFTLSAGADKALFAIDVSTGVLSFLTAPDYEAPLDANRDNIYEVVVQVADGTGAVDRQTIAITVTAVNETAPTITSSATASVAENTTTVSTVTASDPDRPAATLSYRVAGGADAALFAIDASTGALSFITAPDFDTPLDAGGDNVYDVTVEVTDGDFSSSQAIAVTVTPVNETPPTITSSATAVVAENTTAVLTLTATDPDRPAASLSYRLAGGADAALFAIDASTGALSFITAPDYETPLDAGGDNIYNVTVEVTDGDFSSSQALAITVTPVNDNTPTITISATASVAENTTTVSTVTATDPDQPAETLGYRLAGGADAALFVIDASTGALSFITAPDYETPLDANGDNVYDVTVEVTDGTFSSTQALAITVTPVNETPPAITSSASAAVAENTTAVLTLTATDPDRPAASLSYRLAGGADAALFAIDASTGALSFIAAPDYETPLDANGDNVYDVVVSASDGVLTVTQTLAISVQNRNEMPQGSDGRVSVAEDGRHVFGLADFGFTDPLDAQANGLGAVQIVAVPGQGSVLLAGVPVADGQWIPAGDILAGLLSYAPAANDNGAAYAALNFRVRDDGGTAGGGVDTEAGLHTLTIDVSVVNDLPVGTDDSYSLDEDTPLIVSGAGVLANDSDPDGDSLSAALLAGPAHGSLTLAADGSLRYAPDVDWSGTDSFSYRSFDGTGYGAPVTVRLVVHAINDAPLIESAAIELVQGGSASVGSNSVVVADSDSAAASIRIQIERVTGGHFELRSTPGVTVGEFGHADLAAGQVVFLHDGSATQPVIVLQANDGQASGPALSVRVSFQPSGGVLPPVEPPVVVTPSPVVPGPSTPAPAKPPATNSPAGARPVAPPAVDGMSSETSRSDGSMGLAPSAVQAHASGDDVPRVRRHGIGTGMLRFDGAHVTLTLGAGTTGPLMEFMLSGEDINSGTSASSGWRLASAEKAHIAPLADGAYADVQVVLQAVELSGVALSVGVVWWATRAGGLVASLLMAAPAWRSFDPLPVLGPQDEDESGWGVEVDDEMVRDEMGAADVFDAEVGVAR